jgi:hypothetical protein
MKPFESDEHPPPEPGFARREANPAEGNAGSTQRAADS